MSAVNYDQLAPTYHQRHHRGSLPGVSAALLAFVRAQRPQRAVEVGCGTGRWLTELAPEVPELFGLDYSLGMLREARQRAPELRCLGGEAGRLPLASGSLDWVFCVTALHHFPQPQAFLTEARRILRPGGYLTIINLDPHAARDQWFVYEYFEGTYAADLERFPSAGQMLDWAAAADFGAARWHVAERLAGAHHGRAILSHYFLQKHSASQLALLSDAAYAAGVHRIEQAIERAEAAGETCHFSTVLHFYELTVQAGTSHGNRPDPGVLRIGY